MAVPLALREFAADAGLATASQACRALGIETANARVLLAGLQTKWELPCEVYNGIHFYRLDDVRAALARRAAGRPVQHGTYGGYKRCTDGPDGGKCEACREHARVRSAYYYQRLKDPEIRPGKGRPRPDNVALADQILAVLRAAQGFPRSTRQVTTAVGRGATFRTVRNQLDRLLRHQQVATVSFPGWRSIWWVIPKQADEPQQAGGR